MSPNPSAEHDQAILEQFTLQAVPFSQATSMKDGAAIALLVDAAQAKPTDCSLDVACGPGLVALSFARVLAHATGIDATPAMLTRAGQLQAEAGLVNVRWDLGSVYALPYPDESFDIVTSRFAWHHLEHLAQSLAEMRRVCRQAGRIIVCDAVACDHPAKALAFNEMERTRDPSTTQFLTELQLLAVFAEQQLPIDSINRYRVPVELERLMGASFPHEGGTQRVRTMILESLNADELGMGTTVINGTVRFAYSAVIAMSRKR